MNMIQVTGVSNAACWLVVFVSVSADQKSALPLKPGWRAVRTIDSEYATQAAAADEKSLFAVSNTTVAQYDRASGKLIATSKASDAKHLNSAFLKEGKVYCAHSNFPDKPDESDIRVFDPSSRKLEIFHQFKAPPGSLVWCVVRGKSWWCCFAHYGKENAKTVLIRYAEGWKESGRWTFPKKVVEDWDGMSASGGIFDGETLLVSHHHFKVLYRLKVPKDSGELELLEALASPFPGQGIAADPKTDGLVGIDRVNKIIVLATKEP